MANNGGQGSGGEVERRFVPLDRGRVEVRESDDGAKGIEGSAAVFGAVADLGFFTEEIARGAFDDVLESDVRGLFNHDPNMILGRTKSRTMRLASNEEGLEYGIPQLPKSRADVLEAVERRDVDGNSFSFIVLEGDERWETREGRPHRIIERVDQLFDVGPVTFPAYQDTRVTARSLDRAGQLERAMHDHLARARTPTFSGTSEAEWSKPTLADYRTGLDLPDVEWPDLSAEDRGRIVAHTLIGSAQADTFDGANFFPVVSPGTGDLNANALRNAISRAPQADISVETAESIQAMARRLLDEEFGDDDDREDYGALEKRVASLEDRVRRLITVLDDRLD